MTVPTDPVPPSTSPSSSPPPIGPLVADRALRRSSPRWVDVLLVAAVALAIGGVAFAIGRQTAPQALPGGAMLPGLTDGGGIVVPGASMAPTGPDASGAPGRGPMGGGPGAVPLGGAGMGLALRGEVVAVGEGSITIRLESGEEQTLALDGATEFRQAAETSAETVAVGATVDIRAGLQPPTAGGGGGTQPALTASTVTVAP